MNRRNFLGWTAVGAAGLLVPSIVPARSGATTVVFGSGRRGDEVPRYNVYFGVLGSSDTSRSYRIGTYKAGDVIEFAGTKYVVGGSDGFLQPFQNVGPNATRIDSTSRTTSGINRTIAKR